MLISKLTIKEFKRIEEVEIDLASITGFVGGNSSGKSSVLQAVQLCASLLQAAHERLKSGRVRFKGSVSEEEVSFRPTHHVLDLRRGSAATQNDGFQIAISGFLEGDDDTDLDKERHFTLDIKRGKNANISLKTTGDLELAGEFSDPERPRAILSSGLSGIPTREELRTHGVLASSVMQGDANTYLRSLLYHLHQDGGKDGRWEVFSQRLDRVLGDARIVVSHDPRKDRHLNIRFCKDRRTVPLDLASTGSLQVIQILAYASYYQPALLLLDEPDAHLHADSQARLLDAMREIVEGGATRILLATHSPALMKRLEREPNAAIIWMEEGKTVDIDPGSREAVPLLMSLGALGMGAGILAPETTHVLLTEDADQEPARLTAIANGADEGGLAVVSYNGCANLPGARRFALLLRDARPDVSIVIHRDRDFRTDQELEFERLRWQGWLASEGADGIHEVFTDLNDIEHAFARPEHLVETLGMSEDETQQVMADAIASKRDVFVAGVVDARNVLRDSLYNSPRMRRKNAWNQAGMPDNAPGLGNWLPPNANTPFPFESCHGKTLFRVLKADLSDAQQKRLLNVSEALEMDSWQQAFTPP